jgi:hypothetical protein
MEGLQGLRNWGRRKLDISTPWGPDLAEGARLNLDL